MISVHACVRTRAHDVCVLCVARSDNRQDRGHRSGVLRGRRNDRAGRTISLHASHPLRPPKETVHHNHHWDGGYHTLKHTVTCLSSSDMSNSPAAEDDGRFYCRRRQRMVGRGVRGVVCLPETTRGSQGDSVGWSCQVKKYDHISSRKWLLNLATGSCPLIHFIISYFAVFFKLFFH